MDIFSYNSVAKGCLYNVCNVDIGIHAIRFVVRT